MGFETTAPTVAATLIKAKDQGLGNLSALSLHKLTPPAMKALMDGGDVNIDGFICRACYGHNRGRAYEFLIKDYKSPALWRDLSRLMCLWGFLCSQGRSKKAGLR